MGEQVGTSAYHDNAMSSATVPSVGMEFESLEQAKELYNKYAHSVGFSVMTRSSKTDACSDNVRYVVFACSREGYRRTQNVNSFKTTPSAKMNCGARVHVIMCNDENKWKYLTVDLNHNHELSPHKSRHFKAFRQIDLKSKRRLQVNDQAGVRMNRNVASLAVEAGGYENLTYNEKDCRNFIEKERRLKYAEGDGEALRKYFCRMQDQNENFYHEIDLDNEMRVRNVFWADARSRAAYSSFGDVITFDTTYLTNKYQMPFAPIIGVNHHGQSILLGCGLLSNEDTNTFQWLFEALLRCMSNCAPKAIITDQCKAMQRAIQIVFPEAQHRWCLWHIMRKLPGKFGACKEYTGITYHVQNAVYDSLTVDEFEQRWKTAIDRFDLSGHEWLKGLYTERHRWVPAYLKDKFWAGMSTTQRSEQMNAFFDGYVHSSTTLAQFVDQYDNALQKKVEKEIVADFTSFNTTINCVSTSLIEVQFQRCYTNAKFVEVQDEFRGKINCSVNRVSGNGPNITYKIREEVRVGDICKGVHFDVEFNRIESTFHCQCRLFEFRGILCRHCLVVLSQEELQQVRPEYILQRWRKDVRRKHSYVKSSYDNVQMKPVMARFDKLCKRFYPVGEIRAESDELFQIVDAGVTELFEKVRKEEQRKRNVSYNEPQGYITRTAGGSLEQSDKVRSPVAVPCKGRPRFKRTKCTAEQATKRSSKKVKVGKSNAAQEAMQSSHKISDTGLYTNTFTPASESLWYDSSMSQVYGYGSSHMAHANLSFPLATVPHTLLLQACNASAPPLSSDRMAEQMHVPRAVEAYSASTPPLSSDPKAKQMHVPQAMEEVIDSGWHMHMGAQRST